MNDNIIKPKATIDSLIGERVKITLSEDKVTPSDLNLCTTKRTKNTTAIKKLNVMLHILHNPQGVTEKSINEAAHVMSGRNYPTKLKEQHGILLVEPRERLKDKYSSYYSVYQLRNAEQAHKLVDLILQHCEHYGLTCIDESIMRDLAEHFPDLGTSI
jgi:hypothetical protein